MPAASVAGQIARIVMRRVSLVSLDSTMKKKGKGKGGKGKKGC